METAKVRRRVVLAGAGCLVVLAVIWGMNTWQGLFNRTMPTPWIWVLTAALLIVFVGLIGYAIRGRGAGILIDPRNRVSLARFQALSWTITVISALIVLAAWRAHGNLAGPMAITIPDALLAAMGISAASLAAAPVVLSLRSSQTQPTAGAATPEQTQAATDAALKTGRDPANAAASGNVLGWTDVTDAQWLDMFRGEEVTDGGTADLSKIQQFLITVTLLAIYAGALWSFFSSANCMAGLPACPTSVPVPADKAFLVSMPTLSATFVWLLGISHAGYLVSKATPSAPNPATPAPPDS